MYMYTIGIRRNDYSHPVFDVLEIIVQKVILRTAAATQTSPFVNFQTNIDCAESHFANGGSETNYCRWTHH